jgi:hypothetical protein
MPTIGEHFQYLDRLLPGNSLLLDTMVNQIIINTDLVLEHHESTCQTYDYNFNHQKKWSAWDITWMKGTLMKDKYAKYKKYVLFVMIMSIPHTD